MRAWSNLVALERAWLNLTLLPTRSAEAAPIPHQPHRGIRVRMTASLAEEVERRYRAGETSRTVSASASQPCLRRCALDRWSCGRWAPTTDHCGPEFSHDASEPNRRSRVAVSGARQFLGPRLSGSLDLGYQADLESGQLNTQRGTPRP